MPHCPYCKQFFSAPEEQTTHIRQAHPSETVFVCAQCGASFTRNTGLVAHMITHTGEKPFGCNECGDSFARKVYLKNHMKTHSGEKPCVCTICGMAYPALSALNKHLERKHPFERRINLQLNDAISDYKNSFYDPGIADRYLRNLFMTDYPSCPHCQVRVQNLEEHVANCSWRQGPSRF